LVHFFDFCIMPKDRFGSRLCNTTKVETGSSINRYRVSSSSFSASGWLQPRQEIAAIPDQCRETPSFIDRLRSEASVTIFPVALPFRRSTARRAAMQRVLPATAGDWHSVPRLVRAPHRGLSPRARGKPGGFGRCLRSMGLILRIRLDPQCPRRPDHRNAHGRVPP
jgi:hypothetical protein